MNEEKVTASSRSNADLAAAIERILWCVRNEFGGEEDQDDRDCVEAIRRLRAGTVDTDMTVLPVECAWDTNGYKLVRGNRSMKLTSTQGKMFDLLWRRRPHTVRRDALYDNLYQLRGADELPDLKVIDVLMCHIRRKTEGMGVTIHTHWGVGYWLEVE